MAMSFARPDPSSPASVADATFGTGRRGFDQGEVRDFLRMVAAELGRLQERERFLERELRTAQTNPDLASAQLDEQSLTRLLGEETARVLTTARESAAEIRQKAEQSASQMLSEASDEAARMREEAEIEASRRRSDAAADAEAELAMAKQQGREMVNEARAYRERVLSELARRRELAREQIEQLLHGRDRLMQSFERARLVAVDVVAELQPLGEPDEYVNLSPTTGPVPVMVPNSPRPTGRVRTPEIAESSGPSDVGEPADVHPAAVDAPESGQVELALVDHVGVEVETVEVDTVEVDEVGAGVEVETAEVEVDEVEAGVGVGARDDSVEVDTIEVDTIEVDTIEVDTVEVGTVEVDEESEPELVASETADAPGGDDRADDTRDDVVVDLFARLRADASLVAVDDVADVADVADVEGAAVAEAQSGDAPADAAPTPAEAEHESTPFEQRDADLTPLIVASAKKLKRVLADEQNEVLDGLRRREPVRQLSDLLPSRADHLHRYRVAVVDDLLAAANAGASLVTPGRVARLKKADATKAAAAGEAVLDEWIIVPLRERLERCVTDGDGDNAGIAKRIRAVYREWKTQHIDEQLDDVIRAAHGTGAFAALEPGVAVDWVADPTHAVCSDCDDNTLGGTVAVGDAFPTGHLFPPAHLGCRCLLLPADR
jgi:DivIVA domain-containing protein